MLIGLETSKTVAAILELQFGVKGSENTSCKKQNMVCLRSGESELMALACGACEGIATRDQRSKLCKCSPGTIVLCTDSSAALGFVKRKLRVDALATWTRRSTIYSLGRWNLDKRILKVHGDSQQVADCLNEITTPRAGHRKALGL